MAMSASFIPFSIPFTSADIATRLETPKMIPSIVSNERNLFAQISFSPTAMALKKFMCSSRLGEGSKLQHPITTASFTVTRRRSL